MGVHAHVLSTGVVVNVVRPGSNEFGINCGREAGFALDGTAGHSLHGRSDETASKMAPKRGSKRCERTTTASGVPFDAEPNQIRSPIDRKRERPTDLPPVVPQ